MATLGIDPGLTGGLAVIGDDGLWLEPMPTNASGVDALELARLIGDWRSEVSAAYLEKVFAVPKSGAHSMLVFGRAYGVVVGVLATYGIRTIEVTPQAWMKRMHLGVKGSSTKEKSHAAFRELFPGVDARRTAKSKRNDDGLVEAALIADYGRTYGIF